MSFNEDRLEELLNRWEELREEGRAVAEAELCSDCPDLLPELCRRTAKLRQIGRFLGGELSDDKDELTAAGRYLPFEFHAHGGLGEVFRARDEELNREVALKRIRSREVADWQKNRFKFEAEITGRLDHPGVVPVYGLGRDAKGRLYYAMRFIGGKNLREALEAYHAAYPSGKVSRAKSEAFQELIDRFISVCQTVGYAHSRNVIHRDIKPPNIMLGDYGETLVVDWGLAKRLPQIVDGHADTVDLKEDTADAGGEYTKMGHIKGDPAYMSPEQAAGRNDLVGIPSDIYCLGSTLYAILTGGPAFSDKNMRGLLEKVKEGNIRPPRQIRGDVPRALEAICLKAMSKEPSRRYATTRELAADLKHWRNGEPVSAWSEPWSVRAGRAIRKHQTLASTLAAIVLVALLGISALAVQQEKSNYVLGVVNVDLKKERDEKDKALKAAELAEKKALGELYEFLVLAADRALDNGDRAFALKSLDACDKELRNIEWQLLYRRALGSRDTWRVTSESAPSVAVSSDGKLVAAARSDRPVRIWNRADNGPAIELAGPAAQVGFIPDSDKLLVLALYPSKLTVAPNRIVEVWSISQRKRLQTLDVRADYFVVSGDGKRLAVVGTFGSGMGQATFHRSQITIFALPNVEEVASSGDVYGDVADVAFSPDHRRLYSVDRSPDLLHDFAGPNDRLNPYAPSHRFSVQAWELNEGQQELNPIYSKDGPQEFDAAHLAIAPDGKKVFISNNQTWRLKPERILLYATESGEQLESKGFELGAAEASSQSRGKRPVNHFKAVNERAGALAVSPDGKRLAAVYGDRVVIFDVKNGEQLQEYTGHSAPPECVVFSRDGKDLFSAGGDDGSVKRWEIEQPFADRTVLRSGQAIYGSHQAGIAFRSDGQRYAVATKEGGIALYDIKSEQPFMTLPPFESVVSKESLRAAESRLPLYKVKGNFRVSGMRFSPDGTRLTAVYAQFDDRIICVWDLTGAKPAVIDFIDEAEIDPNSGGWRLSRYMLSPDGRFLAADSFPNFPRVYRVWELASRKMKVQFENKDYHGWEPRMVFSADGRDFYVEQTDPNAQPHIVGWDLESGNSIDTASLDRLPTPGAQVSRDGKRELRLEEGVIQIVDRQSQRPLIEYGGREAYLAAVFSPDGDYILACKQDSAELFDATPLEPPVDVH